MALAVTALSRELKKIGRLVNPDDFDRYGDLAPPRHPDGRGGVTSWAGPPGRDRGGAPARRRRPMGGARRRG